MRLLTLRVDGFRCLSGLELSPAPGINVLVGANGAGKSSILEAVFLLSHGRSFRGGARDVLVTRGRDAFSVYAEVQDDLGSVTRLGAGRRGGHWALRVDGATVRTLTELVAHCAVTCFEPGSHALIAGSAAERRRFLDWGVFHVEQGFVSTWRCYQRALRQRNALLQGSLPLGNAQFDSWELELAAHAAALDAKRTAYLRRLEPHVARLLDRFLPELGAVRLAYRRGWPHDTVLEDLLQSRRERDRRRGYTHHGAHRADWGVMFELAPQREHLSRGQTKLSALACILAQAGVHADALQEWPLVCLDDLASELDQQHQELVIDALRSQSAQVLVTGTGCTELLRSNASRLFHVEQGEVRPLL